MSLLILSGLPSTAIEKNIGQGLDFELGAKYYKSLF
jgi:hypothetical protein